jgi:hypothetical protein
MTQRYLKMKDCLLLNKIPRISWRAIIFDPKRNFENNKNPARNKLRLAMLSV